jgi:hypothetical protein
MMLLLLALALSALPSRDGAVVDSCRAAAGQLRLDETLGAAAGADAATAPVLQLSAAAAGGGDDDAAGLLFDRTLLRAWRARQSSLAWYDVRTARHERPLLPAASCSASRDGNGESGGGSGWGMRAVLLDRIGGVKRPNQYENLDVEQPFDGARFHFGKAKAEELLFAVRLPMADLPVGAADDEEGAARGEGGEGKERRLRCAPLSADEAADADAVVMTVTPVGEGHVLLLPAVQQRRPQVLTAAVIRKALAFQLASRAGGGGGAAPGSSSSSFRVGFNGLGAHASVNHLHFQAWYSAEHSGSAEYIEPAGARAPEAQQQQQQQQQQQPAVAFAVERAPTTVLGLWEVAAAGGGGGGEGAEDDQPEHGRGEPARAAAAAIAEEDQPEQQQSPPLPAAQGGQRRACRVSLLRLAEGGYPSRAFVVEAVPRRSGGGGGGGAAAYGRQGVRDVAAALMTVVRVLQARNIPHTFLVARREHRGRRRGGGGDGGDGDGGGGDDDDSDGGGDGGDGGGWLRVFLWPLRRDLEAEGARAEAAIRLAEGANRTAVCDGGNTTGCGAGAKAKEDEGDDDGAIIPTTMSLSFPELGGQLLLKDAAEYAALTEARATALHAATSLPEEQFAQLAEEVLEGGGGDWGAAADGWMGAAGQEQGSWHLAPATATPSDRRKAGRGGKTGGA